MTSKANYRPDIDGLRSVAVISVVLFHARFKFARGGFVGVDVFFVITGFLITSIIYREVLAGSFSFKRFYLRRMRRILPAMLTVVGATTVAAFLLLLPDDLLAYLNSVKSALFSVSNVFFLLETHGYFRGNGDAMPLLHTWSLGVEEQYYLFWPAVLIVVLRRQSRRTWRWVFGFSLAMGLALSEWAARTYPGAGYYLLPTRAYEIMVGAVPVVFADRIPRFSRRVNDAASVVGIALIVASVVFLSSAATFPGINALWPCVGSLCLVLSGRTCGDTPTAGVANRVLALKPLVFIGLISYSAYLWHWPVIAFLNYRGVELEGAVRLLAITAPFALATLSFVAIERPFRDGLRMDFPRAFVVLVVMPIFCSLSIYGYTKHRDGFPDRFVAIDELRAGTTTRYGRCELRPEVGDAEHCWIGTKDARLDGMLIGDSYADMYLNFMDVLAKDAGMRFGYSANSLTPPIMNVSTGPSPDAGMLAYNRRRVEMAAHYRFVVLVNSWSGYGNDNKATRLWDSQGRDVTAASDQLQEETVDWLVNHGVTPIFVDRPLSPPLRVRMAQLRALKQFGKPIDDYREPIEPRPANYAMSRLKARYPSAIFIHPSDALCEDDSCEVSIKNTLLYRDDGSHLNASGSELLGQTYLARKPNPLRALVADR